jgi:tetratricopeptide (TPR) repeat protein
LKTNKIFFLIFFLFIFIGNFLFAQEKNIPLKNQFKIIKRLIVRKQIYYKLYSNMQKEYIDKAFFTDNEYIYDNYRNIIYELSIFEIPKFIKYSIELVKNYNFDLRPVLRIAKEKIINLYFEKNEDNANIIISKINDLNTACEDLKEDHTWPSWFDRPDSYDKAWNLYVTHRDYINSPDIFLTAIVDLKNHPIPSNPSPPESEIEAFKFYQTGYITRSYESIANCYTFTQKYTDAYEYWEKAVTADGSSSDFPFFYKLSRKIEMARLQLYYLGEPQKALTIAKQLKNEALQQTGEDISVKPMQAEVLTFLGECFRVLNFYDEALSAFKDVKKIYDDLEELYGTNPLWSLYNLPIAIIYYHIGEIEMQIGMFESSRQRIDKAVSLFLPESSGNATYLAPRFHEKNIFYKNLSAEKTKLSIDKQKSTRFFFPGKLTAKIYYRFKYIPPKSRVYNNFIKLEITKTDAEEPVYQEEIENPQESDELNFEWSGLMENGLPIEQGDYSIQISYYSIKNSKNEKDIISADEYLIQVGYLCIDEFASDLVFPLKDSETTKCNVIYGLYLPAALKNVSKLTVYISNKEQNFNFANELEIVEGINIFPWNVILKEDDPLLPSKNDEISKIKSGTFDIKFELLTIIPDKGETAFTREAKVISSLIDLDIIPFDNEWTNLETLDEKLDETV